MLPGVFHAHIYTVIPNVAAWDESNQHGVSHIDKHTAGAHDALNPACVAAFTRRITGFRGAGIWTTLGLLPIGAGAAVPGDHQCCSGGGGGGDGG